MSTRSYRANELLADALVQEARHSWCVAQLIGLRSPDGSRPPCLGCSHSDDCYAWNAMEVLSYQEILAAIDRSKRYRRRMWMRDGKKRSFDPIQVVAPAERRAA